MFSLSSFNFGIYKMIIVLDLYVQKISLESLPQSAIKKDHLRLRSHYLDVFLKCPAM